MGCHRSRLPANAAAVPAAVYPRQEKPMDAAKILAGLRTWAEAESARAQAEKAQARSEGAGSRGFASYKEGREDAMDDLADKIEELGRETG